MASTKKIFCGGHCVKSINPRKKMKYVSERWNHIGAGNAMKSDTDCANKKPTQNLCRSCVAL